jgi:hypothetical protein
MIYNLRQSLRLNLQFFPIRFSEEFIEKTQTIVAILIDFFFFFFFFSFYFIPKRESDPRPKQLTNIIQTVFGLRPGQVSHPQRTVTFPSAQHRNQRQAWESVPDSA